MESQETSWSSWMWDEQGRKYKYKIKANGECLYVLEGQQTPEDDTTPRQLSASANAVRGRSSSTDYDYTPTQQAYVHAPGPSSAATFGHLQYPNQGYSTAVDVAQPQYDYQYHQQAIPNQNQNYQTDPGPGQRLQQSPYYGHQNATSAPTTSSYHGYSAETIANQAAYRQQADISSQQTSTSSGVTTTHQTPADARTINKNHTRELDSKYRRLRGPENISRFFKPARVFALLWTEPAGSSVPDTEMTNAFSVIPFRETAYTEIRRFIVLKSHSHHSLCVPILTYRGYGTLNRHDGPHHAIAYASNSRPQTIEGEMLDKHPIRITMEPGETLKPQSRINFSKVYTIEHNVKVKSIGKVDDEYFEWVRQYFTSATSLT